MINSITIILIAVAVYIFVVIWFIKRYLKERKRSELKIELTPQEAEKFCDDFNKAAEDVESEIEKPAMLTAENIKKTINELSETYKIPNMEINKPVNSVSMKKIKRMINLYFKYNKL